MTENAHLIGGNEKQDVSEISIEEKAAMQDSFARLLGERGDEEAVRKAMVTPLGYDPQLWHAMAEMGLLGVLVDPEFGGIGGDAVLLEGLMEVAGGHLLCGPFISTSVMAASLISACSDEERKAEMLPAICGGNEIFTVAATGEQGLWTVEDISVTASNSDNGCTLAGVASFVMHAEGASRILVFAKTGDAIGAYLVNPDASGVTTERLDTNDPTLHLSKIVFSNVSAEQLAGVEETAIGNAMDLAHVALAGEHAGGVKRIFDMRCACSLKS